MNFTEFIKKVDQAAKGMTAENLAAFLHDVARTIPEYQREDFIGRLLSSSSQSAEAGHVQKLDAHDRESLIEEIGKMTERLESIDSGEVLLLEELNESYDDWYGYERDDEEFCYEDPENICESMEQACSLVHECVDREMYQECYDLADLLLQMDVGTDGEYGGETLTLQDLISNGMVSQDFEAFVMDALLAAYWGNSLPDRPDAIYWTLVAASEKKITLEALMQQSPKELEQFQEFLKLWIEYLGKTEGNLAERLLQEAVTLADSPDVLLDVARKYTGLHPILYVRVLEQYQAKSQPGNAPLENAQPTAGQSDHNQPAKSQLEKGLEIGREALARIPINSQERNQAALLSAEFALCLDNREEAEACWLEAFRSKCSVVNYMRLVLECQDFEKYRQQTEEICQRSFAGSSPREGYGYYSVNRPYYAIQFFGGHFQRMMAEGMNAKGPLGWSGTFMKEGMGLLFLYLYQGESLLGGCSQMCGNCIQSLNFHTEDYLAGMNAQATAEAGLLSGDTAAKKDQEFFWELFRKWRQQVQISGQEQEAFIQKLEQWVEMRVTGIMEKKHRKCYGECAAFVAALGEVKESRGEAGAKQRTLEAYRSAYPRHRAFHQELRAFGMR